MKRFAPPPPPPARSSPSREPKKRRGKNKQRKKVVATDLPSITVKYVKSIKGWNEQSWVHVPRLVTYDWLEDTFEDKKPMKHFWAYDPGRPRDIEAMLNGRRKTPRKLRAAKAIELGAEEASDDADTDQETVAKDKNWSKSADEKATTAEKKTAESQVVIGNLDANKDGKPLGAALHIHNSTAQGAPKSDPSDKTAHMQKQTKKVTIPEEEVIPSVDNRPWGARVQARIFHDKDKFPYHVELTRKQDDLKWILAVFESTSNSVPKAYRFRAVQYSAKGDIILEDLRDPVPSLHAALEVFNKCFYARTEYAWDERLLRVQAEQPRWQYRAPAAGKPTGCVSREYTPGHPDCVKTLSPMINVCGSARAVKARQERILSGIPRRPKIDKNTQWEKMLMEKRGQSQKRKADEALDPERQSQLLKKQRQPDKVLKSVPST